MELDIHPFVGTMYKPDGRARCPRCGANTAQRFVIEKKEFEITSEYHNNAVCPACLVAQLRQGIVEGKYALFQPFSPLDDDGEWMAGLVVDSDGNRVLSGKCSVDVWTGPIYGGVSAEFDDGSLVEITTGKNDLNSIAKLIQGELIADEL